jgi:hypothetical protein
LAPWIGVSGARDEFGRQPLDSQTDGDVIYGDATLGEQSPGQLGRIARLRPCSSCSSPASSVKDQPTAARGGCCRSGAVRLPGQRQNRWSGRSWSLGSGMDRAADASGAQLVDTACAAAVYCPA